MKYIKLPPEKQQAAIADAMRYLNNLPVVRPSSWASKHFEVEPKESRAEILYTPEAWLKTSALIQSFKTEVGWRGLVRRVSDTRFLIYDIVVYDQIVTGGNIDSTPEDDFNSLMRLGDEEIRDMHMHGHSHVNFGVFASGTDKEHQYNILSNMNGEGFYIFQIFNKRGDIATFLYNFETNLLYENEDVDISIQCSNGGTLADFIAEAQSYVRTPGIVEQAPQKDEPEEDEIPIE